MSDSKVLYGDQGTTKFCFDDDNVYVVRVIGVHGNYNTELATEDELKIIFELDYSADKTLYSKNMKGENEFEYLLDKPMELKGNERIRVDFPKTDKTNTFRVHLDYDLLYDGKIVHSVRHKDYRLTKKV